MLKGRTFGQQVLLNVVVIGPPVLTMVTMFQTTDTGYRGPVIVSVGQNWWPFFSAVMLNLLSFGVILYWLRENKRLIYGIAETAFAICFMVYNVIDFVFDERLFSQMMPFDKSMIVFGGFAQVAAAFYVFVRGMDNIGQSFKNTRTERVWAWLSLKAIDNKEQK